MLKNVYLDYDAAAAHHLAGFALAVDLAQPDPLAKLLVVIDLKITACIRLVPSLSAQLKGAFGNNRQNTC